MTLYKVDLKQGHGPLIEECVRDVGEPQKSALFAMLLAAELRFRVQKEKRPRPDDYRRRFPDHLDLIAAVFTTALGPERIGPFVVVRLLGEGNFGRVYLCRDEQLDRLVAVKVPRSDRFDGTKDLDRFLQEGAACRPGQAPRHCRRSPHRPRPGRRLLPRSRVHRGPVSLPSSGCCMPNGSLSRRAAQMVILMADALAHAHEQGLVHRDLKPDNILLDEAAKRPLSPTSVWPCTIVLTGGRRKVRSPARPYMAPEQVRGGMPHRLDGRTDIWGLGVILYRMLTEYRPFDGNCSG